MLILVVSSWCCIFVWARAGTLQSDVGRVENVENLHWLERGWGADCSNAPCPDSRQAVPTQGLEGLTPVPFSLSRGRWRSDRETGMSFEATESVHGI